MKINKLPFKMRCDMGLCGNVAEWTISGGGPASGNINLCGRCFLELYRLSGEKLTPKSPENMVLKRQKNAKNS